MVSEVARDLLTTLIQLKKLVFSDFKFHICSFSADVNNAYVVMPHNLAPMWSRKIPFGLCCVVCKCFAIAESHRGLDSRTIGTRRYAVISPSPIQRISRR